MILRPRGLPKARAQTIRRMDGLMSRPNPFVTGTEGVAGLMARHLKAADLYWASEDMTALAMHAGEQLAAARWATADRPSPCGLIVFDGGLGMVQVHPAMHGPVAALAWGPGPDETLVVWHLMTAEQFLGGASVPNPEAVPPLIGIREVRLPVTSEPVPLDDLPPHEGMAPSRAIVAALAASWHLMQQPQLVDRTEQEPHRSDARALRRAGTPDSGVSVVALRRQYVPQDRDPDAGTDQRTYRNRWIVSGHWRNQAHGPERSLRRQTWVPAHMKGPEGAPLLSTEKVNVWRR
ncbi:hypothetical protein AB0L71_28245 [Streptomyces sp. NPDC052052]|uniref:hypothetical protein n=1 Tax=Streptomyces sp. NPDC052052 TaxID=3154756 RepID=UPI00342B0BD1